MKTLLQMEEISFRKKGWKMIVYPLLITGLFLFGYWYYYDFRQIPENLSISTSTEIPSVVVRGFIQHEVRPDNFFDIINFRPHISFDLLVQNSGDRAFEIKEIITSMYNQDGSMEDKVILTYGGRSTPTMAFYPGESRSFWAGGILFPKNRFEYIEWDRVEIMVRINWLNELEECTIQHFQDIEFDFIDLVDDQTYKIEGRILEDINDIQSSVRTLPAIFLSFINEQGEFIGRRTIRLPRGEVEFSDSFNIYDPVESKPFGHYDLGGNFTGKPDSYEFHFIETENEYNCP